MTDGWGTATAVLRCLATPLGFCLCLGLAGTGLCASGRESGAMVSAAGLGLLYLASMPCVGQWLLQWLARDAERVSSTGSRQAEAIVVLGGGLQTRAAAPPWPTGPGIERLAHGVDLLRRGSGQVLLLSGGRSRRSDGGWCEARAMAEVCRAWDVPAAKLLVEDRSRNTIENGRYTCEVLRAAGLRTALVVTSPWHMRRALRSFRGQGLEVQPAPAGRVEVWRGGWLTGVLPSIAGLQATTTAAREGVGLVVAWVVT